MIKKTLSRLVLVSVLSIGLPSPVQSQDTTWTGAANTEYNEPGNWTSGVPDGNDAYIGAGSSLATSEDAPNLLRMNLQNTNGLFTLGHSLTMQRLDDNHATLVGNGTFGNMRIVGGGNLTFTGDSSAELLNLHGRSGNSTFTIDGGTLTTNDATKRFSIGRAGNQGATFTLNSGTVDIAGRVDVGDGSSAKGEMNLNGGSFNFGGHFVVANNNSSGGNGGLGGIVNIDGASVLATGTGLAPGVAPVFRIGRGDTFALDRGLVNLTAGSLQLAENSRMELGRDGGGGSQNGVGRFLMSGGDFYAPGETTLARTYIGWSAPSNTINGIPVDDSGNINMSGGTAHIEGELRIGAGSLAGTSTLGGVYVHRGGEMMVSNSDGTGKLRIALASLLVISGGTVTADSVQIDAGTADRNPASLWGRGGTLIGPVEIAGILSPGLQASTPQGTTTGTLNIFGDLTLADTAETFFDFKNPLLTAGTFDSISNDGTDTVSFDGHLTIRFFGTDEYQSGTVDLFNNFANYTGNFSSVTVTGLTHGEVATFNPSNGELTIATMQNILGDVNCDGTVNLLDVTPFVDLVVTGVYMDKADINGDGLVNLLDVQPFVSLLTGN